MKIKTLIIDDEAPARMLIKKFLEEDEDFEIIGEASNGFEGYKLSEQLKPDFIFLDIQMPKLSGLEMLELLENPPLVIFSTAFEEHAVEAFEREAVDYLLKPYSKERFIKTLTKVKEKLKLPSGFTSNPNISKENSGRIVVKQGAKIHIIYFEEIYYLEADGDYVKIHSKQGVFLKQITLKQLETIAGSDFIRVHRSFLVNISAIEKLELHEKETYLLLLTNGHRVNVSRSGYGLLRTTLGW